jgi:hypothetical protein
MSPETSSVLQQFIGTILGGLISGIIGLWIENKRRANERREKHFQELKERCLTPLKVELSRLYNCFEYSEGSIPDVDQMEETLKSIRWWDYYSLKNCCDGILFEDLSNHFPELAKKLEEVENGIKQKYPEFYKNILGLLREIYSCMDLEKLSHEVVTSSGKQELQKLPYDVVFLIALGYAEERWPNAYSFFKKRDDLAHEVYPKAETEMDIIRELGKRYSESGNCRRAKEIRNDMKKLKEECTREIDVILYKKELKGKCKYI